MKNNFQRIKIKLYFILNVKIFLLGRTKSSNSVVNYHIEQSKILRKKTWFFIYDLAALANNIWAWIKCLLEFYCILYEILLLFLFDSSQMMNELPFHGWQKNFLVFIGQFTQIAKWIFLLSTRLICDWCFFYWLILQKGMIKIFLSSQICITSETIMEIICSTLFVKINMHCKEEISLICYLMLSKF